MEPILRLDKVNKRFGGVVAANDVSFSLLPGEIHGLIGPNGAGKSTLMNLISGIYDCDSGNIYFEGKDITKTKPYTRAKLGIGRTFQTPRFLNRSSIRDNLLLGTDLNDDFTYLQSFFGKKGANFDKELDYLMGIAGFTIDETSDIDGIPFGKRKLLEIVRTMLTHPKVMLVDEPAAGLNHKEIEKVIALLNEAAKNRGVGVLLIEHAMDLVMNICEQIVVINFGTVIGQGTPDEVSNNQQVIAAYLGRGDEDA